MGLSDIPTRAGSSVYDDEGTTRVPKDLRNTDDLRVVKGSKLVWVKYPDDDYLRVYPRDQLDNIEE